MGSIDDLLNQHARAWQAQVDARSDQTMPRFVNGLPPAQARPGRRRSHRVMLGIATAAVICVGLGIAAIVTHQPPRRTPLAAPSQSTSRPEPRSGHSKPGTSHPGLAVVPNPPAQPWGDCGNIRNKSDARRLVAEGQADALITARIRRTGSSVASYRVLVGHVDHLQRLDDGGGNPNDDYNLRPGRYLVLLGGPPYYVAFGDYGVYRLVANSAHQLCAYGSGPVRRTGVTDARKIISLLRDALTH